MFELPKQYTFDAEETGRLRNEARIEIGKFLFHSGELEKAIKMLEEVEYTKSAYDLQNALLVRSFFFAWPEFSDKFTFAK